MAHLKFLDIITKNIENNEITAGIFLDLSKAFDTIDHKILLSKLEFYGIRGVANTWFENYLSNRYQFVNFKNMLSSTSHIKCGVLQGSILGPLLFILYINDIIKSSSDLNFILFADDTSSLCSDKDPEILNRKLYNEIIKVQNWLIANTIRRFLLLLTLLVLGVGPITMSC